MFFGWQFYHVAYMLLHYFKKGVKMKTLLLMQDERVLKEIKVGDNITKKQISETIKFYFDCFAFLISYKII